MQFVVTAGDLGRAQNHGLPRRKHGLHADRPVAGLCQRGDHAEPALLDRVVGDPIHRAEIDRFGRGQEPESRPGRRRAGSRRTRGWCSSSLASGVHGEKVPTAFSSAAGNARAGIISQKDCFVSSYRSYRFCADEISLSSTLVFEDVGRPMLRQTRRQEKNPGWPPGLRLKILTASARDSILHQREREANLSF